MCVYGVECGEFENENQFRPSAIKVGKWSVWIIMKNHKFSQNCEKNAENCRK